MNRISHLIILIFKKMALIALLYKCFIDNLSNFPNHVIRVRKQDFLKIESIDISQEYSGVNLTSSSEIDLSKLRSLSKFNLKVTIEYNLT